MSAPGSRPWLSLVTVVKDDAIGFARTAGSIAGQDLDGVEFIVIDGSADRDAVPGLVVDVGIDGAQCTWHEPQGVYRAMNDGLAASAGDYVYYANAGDTLEPGALVEIRRIADSLAPTWLYGQVRFVDERGVATIPPPFDYLMEKRQHFSRGRFPPHQGTVVSREALTSIGGFDESYRITADYAAFLRLSLIADPAITHRVLATFHQGGLSSTSWRDSLREFHRARVGILDLSGPDRARDTGRTLVQFARIAAYRSVSSLRATAP